MSNKRKAERGRKPANGHMPSLEEALGGGGRAALLASHCELVEQVANLAVVVVALWEQNNRLREAAGLPRASLPVEGSLACAAGRGVVGACEAKSCG